MASRPKRTLTVTFKAVGPIKRSILGEEDPDPRAAALIDALHWVWSCQLQIRRLGEALESEGRNPRLSPTQRRIRFSRTTFEEHALLVAAFNLTKALTTAERCGIHLQLSSDMRAATTELRHIYEHWERQRDSFRQKTRPKSDSGSRFLRRFPHGEPWALFLQPDGDIVIGNVVPLRQLFRELRELEQQLLALQASPGK
jgi:hypothetical protein